jgi:hypothetical protein
MRNLARPLLRLLGRDDRGAVGVLIAVLLAGGVLLGMGALTIDVGQIYQNRAELQNGADAAALAIATQCARGTCPANALTTAVTYASDNASALTGDVAGVDCVHGVSGGNTFSDGSCPSGFNGGSGLTNCPTDPTTGNFVDVQTETGTVSTLLPPVFAQTVVGNSTYNGTNVKACAQAEWGAGGALAFTISTCEFNVATNGTTSQPGNLAWNPANGTPSYPADVEYDIQFLVHSSGNGNNSTCPTGPANHVEPGAFGWTAGTGNGSNKDCVTAITDTNGVYTYGADPGASALDCSSVLDALWHSHGTALVPVYGSVTGNGQNTEYTLAGYVPMVITGFNVQGGCEIDWLNPSLLPSCGGTGSTTSIDGYLLSDALLPPGSSTAVYGSVKLSG